MNTRTTKREAKLKDESRSRVLRTWLVGCRSGVRLIYRIHLAAAASGRTCARTHALNPSPCPDIVPLSLLLTGVDVLLGRDSANAESAGVDFERRCMEIGAVRVSERGGGWGMRWHERAEITYRVVVVLGPSSRSCSSYCWIGDEFTLALTGMEHNTEMNFNGSSVNGARWTEVKGSWEVAVQVEVELVESFIVSLSVAGTYSSVPTYSLSQGVVLKSLILIQL